MVVSLVYGFDRRALAASLGITAGVIVTAVSGIIFTEAFKIHGAVMDLAVDITSAVSEVARKRPDITRAELIKSGMNVGRAAMGTITTTLLLDYSGSCIALLICKACQGQ